MTPEAQRIALAEWAGWEGVCVGSWLGLQGARPGDHRIDPLPDYLNDLNAMHEAEGKLTFTDGQEYASRLRELGKIRGNTGRWIGDDDFIPIHATAAQRAEALLRTIGKWRDE